MLHQPVMRCDLPLPSHCTKTKTCLLFLEQRLSLSVLIDNSATLEGILANETREADQDGEDEQDAHDDKGEDPLERDDVGEELGDTESYI